MAQGPLVPLRPLGLGEVLDGAVEAVRRNPRTALGFGAALMAVQQAVAVPVQYLVQDVALTASDSSDPVAILTGLLALGVSSAAVLAVGTVLSVVLGGAMAVVVGEAVLGRRPGPAEVWVRVRRRLFALLGLGAGVTVALGVGLLGLGLGAVFVFVVVAVTAPVLMLEDAGVVAAFRRSWRLTIRDFWRVLGIRALAYLVSTMLTVVLALPFTIGAVVLGGGPFASGATPLSALALAALGALVAGAVAGPFGGAVDALLYLDRRMRAEGLDIDLGQRARAGAGAPA
jgi:MFS family permease